jgi:predicted ArsR family transcriptional regulator
VTGTLKAMPGSHPLGSEDAAARIAAISTLNEPIRRNLYAYIVDRPEAVGREEAAEAVGITRELAAFHLDKLLEEGLLDVEYRRISGRSGPGAGRPAKLYRPSGRHVHVSLPERRYDLAARLMAEALEEPSDDPGGAVDRAARRFGQTLGSQARKHMGRRPSRDRLLETACAILREQGFEPVKADNEILLRNCPFDSLAKDHVVLICGMNLALVEGLLDGLGAEGVNARLDPMPGRCCVALGSNARKPNAE